MFLVFAFDNYYPAGGCGDLVGAFDTLEQARRALLKALLEGKNDGHIYDVELKIFSYYDVDEGWAVTLS